MKNSKLIIILLITLSFKLFSQTTYYDNNTTLYGIIDKTGNSILKPTYKYLSKIINDVCVFSQGHNYGLLDKTGKIILKPIFHSPCCLQNAKITDGLIKVIDIKYLSADSSSYDYSFGFYNTMGNLIIKCEYGYFSNFCNGQAVVGRKKGQGYEMEFNMMNTKGQLLNQSWVDDESKLNAITNCEQTDDFNDKIYLEKFIHNNQKIIYKNEKIELTTNINSSGTGIFYNKKVDRALIFENDSIAYLINGKGEIIVRISDKINDLDLYNNLNFEFINGLGQLAAVKEQGHGDMKISESEFWLIDVDGNIIKRMQEPTVNVNVNCNDGNR